MAKKEVKSVKQPPDEVTVRRLQTRLIKKKNTEVEQA